MKVLNILNRKGLGVITGLFLIFFVTGSPKAKANTVPGISFEVFYENLAPYGQWINDAQYGQIWAPAVGADFRPYYSDGYWVNTNYGNMWVSNYEWGWAPFHYGRWTVHNRYGWVWVPGYEWGPSWVTWRSGGGYYGWAPMAPGVSISVSFGSGYHIPDNYWTFVPYRNLYSTRVYSYHYANRVPAIMNRTTIINNTYVDNSVSYVTGPSRSEVRRTVGTNVKTYNVSNTDRRSVASRIDGNNISVYRPETSRRAVKSTANNNNRTAVSRSSTPTTSSNVNNGTTSRRTVNTAPAATRSNVNSGTTPARSATPAAAPAQRSTATKPAAATRSTRAAQTTTSRAPSPASRVSTPTSSRRATMTAPTRSSSVNSSASRSTTKSAGATSRRR